MGNASPVAGARSEHKPLGDRTPNFIIIGSAKCGTTALHSILDAHPDCCMSYPKEGNFFRDGDYEKGLSWYKRVFSHYKGELVIGEASPDYTCRSRWPSTAKWMYEFNPDLKLIYMVRHPLARQISAWKMIWAFGAEGAYPTIETDWAQKGLDYWLRMEKDGDPDKPDGWPLARWDACCYDYQLAAFLEYFPAEQIQVTFIEDWKRGKDQELERIMRFVGLDPSHQPPKIEEKTHLAEDRTIVSSSVVKAIMRQPASLRLVQKFPSGVRKWLKGRIPRSEFTLPELDLTQETKTAFLDFVRDDAQEFLKRYGKPADFWDLSELVPLGRPKPQS